MEHLKVKEQGSHRTVAFLKYGPSDCPASDFLELPEKDLAEAAFRAYMKLIANNPRPLVSSLIWRALRSKKSKYDCKGLSELRHLSSKSRLFLFFHACNGLEFQIITHGITKKEDDLDDAEVKRIIDARDWFMKVHKCPPGSPPPQPPVANGKKRRKK